MLGKVFVTICASEANTRRPLSNRQYQTISEIGFGSFSMLSQKKLAIFRLRFDIVSVDGRENRGDHLPSAILTDKCFVVPFLIIVELFILPSVLFCRTCKFCCWIAVVLAQTLLLFAGEIAAIVIELLLASLFSATQIEKKKVSKGEISFNWLFYILFVFSMENSRLREFSYLFGSF